MSSRIDFTSGSVPRALIHFALPVMFALFLQAMYGTVIFLSSVSSLPARTFPLWLQDPRSCRL